MSAKKNNISSKLLNSFKGDKAIWFIFAALAFTSLVSVFSSVGYSAIISDQTPERAFIKHFFFVVVSFILVILISNFNYRRFSGISWFGFLLSVTLLVFVLVIGHKDNSAGSGMSRWIYIPIIGRFQPSELAKIVMVVYLARLLAQEKPRLHEWPTLRNILIPVFLVLGLIVSDNLSTALIIFIVCYIMLRLTDINARHLRLTILVIALLGIMAMLIGDKMNIPFLARSETWSSRIDKWLNFNEEELSQESMARMAVASGKVFGVGIGSTVQARLMTQANNDMIYAIIIEESGMLGGLAVFALYTFLFIRCIKIACNCRGDFGRLTVVGLGTLIFLQACIHMCVSVGALPVTGQTLPLISSGGSSYLCMSVAIGIIQAVAFDVNSTAKDENSKSPKDPVSSAPSPASANNANSLTTDSQHPTINIQP